MLLSLGSGAAFGAASLCLDLLPFVPVLFLACPASVVRYGLLVLRWFTGWLGLWSWLLSDGIGVVGWYEGVLGCWWLDGFLLSSSRVVGWCLVGLGAAWLVLLSLLVVALGVGCDVEGLG